MKEYMYPSPEEGMDPHPWSEELQALLEDAEFDSDVIVEIIKAFDNALTDEMIVEVDLNQLLEQTMFVVGPINNAYAGKANRYYCSFYNREDYQEEEATGTTLAELYLSMISITENSTLTPLCEYVMGLITERTTSDDFIIVDKAWDILHKVKKTYILASYLTHNPTE